MCRQLLLILSICFHLSTCNCLDIRLLESEYQTSVCFFLAIRLRCQLLFSLATPNSITSPHWMLHLRPQLSHHRCMDLRLSRYTSGHFQAMFKIRNSGVVTIIIRHTCYRPDDDRKTTYCIFIIVDNHTNVSHHK